MRHVRTSNALALSLRRVNCAVQTQTHYTLYLIRTVAEARPSVAAILNINKYSMLYRLLHVTAYVLKAVKLFKGAAQHGQVMLSPAELTEAEKWWILCAQGTLTDDKKFKQL